MEHVDVVIIGAGVIGLAVAAELSGSYLLGIEVETADRDGKPHRVQVKVNRNDVDVRARKQYVIERSTSPAGSYWVVNPPATPVTITTNASTGDVIMSNGLMERTIALKATTAPPRR
jgi:choline dehydrogenase-like flavoprotein